MPDLVWRRHPRIPAALVAVGENGIYLLRRDPVPRGGWVVTGVEHGVDELPLLAIPSGGRTFSSLVEAQRFADRVDAAPHDSQIGWA